MFSTMMTVASTMMPKSIAPIDSRLADSPLITRISTANSSANGMVAETISAAEVTGVVLTKLDGTARGGIVAAIEQEFSLPVKFVGLGESAEDLRPFEPDTFIDALLA